MIRETDTTTDPCPRCVGRGALFMGPYPPEFVVCPDCRGTGSAIVKEYVEWAVKTATAELREALSQLLACADEYLPVDSWTRPALEASRAALAKARGECPDAK